MNEQTVAFVAGTSSTPLRNGKRNLVNRPPSVIPVESEEKLFRRSSQFSRKIKKSPHPYLHQSRKLKYTIKSVREQPLC